MSGAYTCVAYNNVTEKNSTTSTMLTVIEAVESVMIKSSTIPIESDNLTLTCEVTGPFESIYWMKDNMPLNMNTSTINSNVSYYIRSNSLHFSPVTRYDDGIYQCVATTLAGPHKSPQYVLLVIYGPLSVDITGQEISALDTVFVSLTCSADSRPISEYQWFVDGLDFVIGTGPVITYFVTDGNYTCMARNPVTNITMSQTIAVSVNGHASALPVQAQGRLVLLALLALSLPVVTDWLSH
ncbi:carcinoembryonic antigen-related cell adhesion molecule 5-like [Myripristis murdjan]|uniref:carcinoembryonic antigen-related cell adhesion molecule 5-like n=1 Tax=Myripristis murdjan TaxID=586833 RepID=UPI001176351C|nr:carcinoembryonic antigen-related cell adhesion molecule 5-like [Myripristis murdjan]